jgi:hypothetical protein
MNDDEINKHSTELGLAIAIVGICVMILALLLGDANGWLHN